MQTTGQASIYNQSIMAALSAIVEIVLNALPTIFVVVIPIYKEIPLLSDRLLLLDLLPLDLPLELAVKHIYEDVYWKRCYYSKWPKTLPKDPPEENIFPSIVSHSSSSSSSETAVNGNNHKNNLKDHLGSVKDGQNNKPKSWKHYYLEMYLREFLQNLKPEEYDSEKVFDSSKSNSKTNSSIAYFR